jgi:hypothetical protein
MQKTWKEGHGIDTATGMYSMHEESSENWLRLINYVESRNITIKVKLSLCLTN